MARKNGKAPSPIIRQRLARCRREMKKAGIDALLVSKHMDYFYLTGFTGEDSAAIITPREVHLISDGRFDEAIRQEAPWADKRLRKGSLVAEIGAACRDHDVSSLAVQYDGMTLAEHDALKIANRKLKLERVPPFLHQMRSIKDDSELRIMRKAIRIAEDAFESTRAQIRLGQTEEQIAAILEFEMRQRGATGPSFPTIVAEGPNAALPHARPGRRKIKKGSAILIDWGARYRMYCSDLTRVLFVDRIPSRIGDIYAVCLEAQRRAIRAIRPGVLTTEIDGIARGFIKDAGLGDQFNHGLGHSIGLDVHEGPSLRWTMATTIESGMVFTVEPGIYVPGVGGVRIEDDVLVTDSGSRVLSRVEKKLDAMIIAAR